MTDVVMLSPSVAMGKKKRMLSSNSQRKKRRFGVLSIFLVCAICAASSYFYMFSSYSTALRSISQHDLLDHVVRKSFAPPKDGDDDSLLVLGFDIAAAQYDWSVITKGSVHARDDHIRQLNEQKESNKGQTNTWTQATSDSITAVTEKIYDLLEAHGDDEFKAESEDASPEQKEGKPQRDAGEGVFIGGHVEEDLRGYSAEDSEGEYGEFGDEDATGIQNVYHSVATRRRKNSTKTERQLSIAEEIKIRKQKEAEIMKITRSIGSCKGKEYYVKILLLAVDARSNRASVTQLCEKLPTLEQVQEKWGPKPVIVGMDTCQKYRDMLDPKLNNGIRLEPMPRVAGLYHTGTNALARAMEQNFDPLPDFKNAPYFSPYEVPWGKHLPPDPHRLTNVYIPGNREPRKKVLPIVVVRDPFWWMQSMCKHWYDVRWEKPFENNRCPAIVFNSTNHVYPVFAHTHQTHWSKVDNYTSLPGMWAEWNRQYFKADFPRLMVRFEDILYRQDEVISGIRKCIGQSTPRPLDYSIGRTKNHGKPMDFVSALAKYVTDVGRHRGMSGDDRVVTNKVLDEDLMKVFGYKAASLQPEPNDMKPPFGGSKPKASASLWWIPEERRHLVPLDGSKFKIQYRSKDGEGALPNKVDLNSRPWARGGAGANAGVRSLPNGNPNLRQPPFVPKGGGHHPKEQPENHGPGDAITKRSAPLSPALKRAVLVPKGTNEKDEEGRSKSAVAKPPFVPIVPTPPKTVARHAKDDSEKVAEKAVNKILAVKPIIPILPTKKAAIAAAKDDSEKEEKMNKIVGNSPDKTDKYKDKMEALDKKLAEHAAQGLGSEKTDKIAGKIEALNKRLAKQVVAEGLGSEKTDKTAEKIEALNKRLAKQAVAEELGASSAKVPILPLKKHTPGGDATTTKKLDDEKDATMKIEGKGLTEEERVELRKARAAKKLTGADGKELTEEERLMLRRKMAPDIVTNVEHVERTAKVSKSLVEGKITQPEHSAAAKLGSAGVAASAAKVSNTKAALHPPKGAEGVGSVKVGSASAAGVVSTGGTKVDPKSAQLAGKNAKELSVVEKGTTDSDDVKRKLEKAQVKADQLAAVEDPKKKAEEASKKALEELALAVAMEKAKAKPADATAALISGETMKLPKAKTLLRSDATENEARTTKTTAFAKPAAGDTTAAQLRETKKLPKAKALLKSDAKDVAEAGATKGETLAKASANVEQKTAKMKNGTPLSPSDATPTIKHKSALTTNARAKGATIPGEDKQHKSLPKLAVSGVTTRSIIAKGGSAAIQSEAKAIQPRQKGAFITDPLPLENKKKAAAGAGITKAQR